MLFAKAIAICSTYLPMIFQIKLGFIAPINCFSQSIDHRAIIKILDQVHKGVFVFVCAATQT